MPTALALGIGARGPGEVVVEARVLTPSGGAWLGADLNLMCHIVTDQPDHSPDPKSNLACYAPNTNTIVRGARPGDCRATVVVPSRVRIAA
jgi:hypothetical protein